jgi:hypothetical protein
MNVRIVVLYLVLCPLSLYFRGRAIWCVMYAIQGKCSSSVGLSLGIHRDDRLIGDIPVSAMCRNDSPIMSMCFGIPSHDHEGLCVTKVRHAPDVACHVIKRHALEERASTK